MKRLSVVVVAVCACAAGAKTSRLRDLPATATVMRESRAVSCPNGLLEDDFAPFAIHVYRF